MKVRKKEENQVNEQTTMKSEEMEKEFHIINALEIMHIIYQENEKVGKKEKQRIISMKNLQRNNMICGDLGNSMDYRSIKKLEEEL